MLLSMLCSQPVMNNVYQINMSFTAYILLHRHGIEKHHVDTLLGHIDELFADACSRQCDNIMHSMRLLQ
jgi:hypothetical protein